MSGNRARSSGMTSACAGLTNTPVTSAAVGLPVRPLRKVIINEPSRYAVPPEVPVAPPVPRVGLVSESVYRPGFMPPRSIATRSRVACVSVAAFAIPCAGITAPAVSTAVNAGFASAAPPNKVSLR